MCMITMWTQGSAQGYLKFVLFKPNVSVWLHPIWLHPNWLHPIWLHPIWLHPIWLHPIWL